MKITYRDNLDYEKKEGFRFYCEETGIDFCKVFSKEDVKGLPFEIKFLIAAQEFVSTSLMHRGVEFGESEVYGTKKGVDIVQE